MNELEKELVIEGAKDRGESISPIMPNANWISLKGNFTPNELRAIADSVDAQFIGKKINYGNKN